MRVISRMTDSVNVAVRVAASTSIYPRILPSALRIRSAAPRPLPRLPPLRRAPGVRRVRRPAANSRATRAREWHPRRRRLPAAGRSATDATCRSSSLSARSRMICSAFLRPTRGTLCKRRDVLVADRADQPLGGERGQQAERQRRPHALGVEHALKHPPLERRREAEQLPRVFLDDEMRVQRHGLARRAAASRRRRAESPARRRRRPAVMTSTRSSSLLTSVPLTCAIMRARSRALSRRPASAPARS